MGKTAVVTGANRGIGLALSQELKRRGYTIFGVCRTPSSELETLTEHVIEGIDVSRPDHLAVLVERLQGQKIDLLVNNAGAGAQNVLGEIDYTSLQQLMTVNAFAPLRLTEMLLDHIPSGGKIAMISSRMGSIEDNDSGGNYGYRASKAALNALSKSLAIDLKPRGIAVAILHPGYVQTRMVGFSGHLKPEEAAAGLADRMDALDLTNSGTFWHSNGEVLPW